MLAGRQLCSALIRSTMRSVLDPALAALVPEEIEVLKTGALPARFTRPFGIGDIGLRSWAFLRQTSDAAAEQRAALAPC